MSNILLYLLIILMGIMGGLSSVIVLVMIPVVLIRKFYGKIRYGKKMTDRSEEHTSELQSR